MERVWRLLISVEACLALLAAVCCAMAAGSFLLQDPAARAINAMPLFAWLAAAPVTASWWLWLTVALLALLVVNAVACSIESIRTRWTRQGLLRMLSPQLVHLGFLLIIAAHLLSALGGSVRHVEAVEGMVAALPDGRRFGIAAIDVVHSPQGMPTGFNARLVPDPESNFSPVSISPNRPWFSGGYGVYLKQADLYPVRWALLEIHREPGAGMALAGALLFTAGNLLILSFRSRSGANFP